MADQVDTLPLDTDMAPCADDVSAEEAFTKVN